MLGVGAGLAFNVVKREPEAELVLSTGHRVLCIPAWGGRCVQGLRASGSARRPEAAMFRAAAFYGEQHRRAEN